eukprot:8816462-Pyramimonas_sp.AAC.1
MAYKYRAHIAKRLRSVAFHRETSSCALQAHLIQSDATNHEAIQREKVHAGLITTLVAAGSAQEAEDELNDFFTTTLVPLDMPSSPSPGWARRHCVP